MTALSYLYKKLKLLKFPVVALLLVLLWFGASIFVLVVDINNQHTDLYKLYQLNSLSHDQALAISKSTLRVLPSNSKESLDMQISQIQTLKTNLIPTNLSGKFSSLKPKFDSDKNNLVRVIDNNLIKINLQICQGDKIDQINQILLEISKIDIKPYSKAIISELEQSFGKIKVGLNKIIDLDHQLIRCFTNASSSFISQDNFYSLIRFGKYLSGVDQIYSRVIETLRTEDSLGLETGLNMIKNIDINNFVTLNADFLYNLEKNKNPLLEKDVVLLNGRKREINTFQTFVKENISINFTY